jgi:hypothetical protein
MSGMTDVDLDPPPFTVTLALPIAPPPPGAAFVGVGPCDADRFNEYLACGFALEFVSASGSRLVFERMLPFVHDADPDAAGRQDAIWLDPEDDELMLSTVDYVDDGIAWRTATPLDAGALAFLPGVAMVNVAAFVGVHPV